MTALLKLILRQTKIGYSLSRYLQMIKVVELVIVTTYCHCVDHTQPTGWADNGTYIYSVLLYLAKIIGDFKRFAVLLYCIDALQRGSASWN